MAYDTDATASCEEKQTRRDRRCNYWRQADVPAAVDEAWHTAFQCQMLVCGVNVLDGYEGLHDRASSSHMTVQASAHQFQLRT